jgi:hypothetical protein
VAERVVDDLEIVEIEKQNGGAFGGAAPPAEDLVEPPAQQAAIGQPGKTVVLGNEIEPLFGTLALGDVDQREQDHRLAVVDQVA